MLFYVFWHWPRPEVEIADYESDEIAFQAAVRDARPEGLVANGFSRCSGVPWANGGGPAYEDLFLLENSAALDVLNEIAVNGERKPSHDRLAAAMLSGAAALYSLSRGKPSRVPSGPAVWCRKPVGMPYVDFYASLSAVAEQDGVSLWRRQMVLSPAPEFCAFGFDPSLAMSGTEPVTMAREPLWPRP